MSKIPSKMVEIDNIYGNEKVTLSGVLFNRECVPISMWGKPTPENIQTAINRLKDMGGGSLRIPSDSQHNVLIIRVMWGKVRAASDMVVRYEYSDWRPPNNVKEDGVTVGEYRPYTKDPWQAGDIIYNSDYANSDDRTCQWFCGVSGTDELPAGKWYCNRADLPTGGAAVSFSYDSESRTLFLT